MNSSDKALLRQLAGQSTSVLPVWLMRQAGRYLPEYRQVRSAAKDFIDLCLSPKLAVEVTLQPITRYDFDASIVFADILLIPYALGQNLKFAEGEGPVLQPVQDERQLAMLKFDLNRLMPVCETLQLMKQQLPTHTARIGFAGSPWTVACYMIEGRGKQGFKQALKASEHQPEFMQKLFEILHEATFSYLDQQILAGAEVIQLFESWAGLLQAEKFKCWVIEPTAKLVKALKQKHPHVPIIGFPRAATPADYKAFALLTGVDAVTIDQALSLDFAALELKPIKLLQGNLDPDLLVQGGDAMRDALENIIRKLGPRHIVNLGHGILQQTPPEHVATLVEIIRAHKFSEVA